MKKWILLGMVICMLGVPGCITINIGENLESPIEETIIDEETICVSVYYPNENADGTEVLEVQCKEVNENILWNLLKQKNVVSEESCVNSIKVSENKIDLDVNEAFGNQLRSYGTAGEDVLMESVVNTFLDAYECEKIKITENGSTLYSGHTEYADYLGKY